MCGIIIMPIAESNRITCICKGRNQMSSNAGAAARHDREFTHESSLPELFQTINLTGFPHW
ncbi:hypothetical protein VXQ18_03860 [Brucella abortus]|nr:hypothetical protein [Brucella abortus]